MKYNIDLIFAILRAKCVENSQTGKNDLPVDATLAREIDGIIFGTKDGQSQCLPRVYH